MNPRHKRGLLIAIVIVLLFVCVAAGAAGGYWATGPSLQCTDPEHGAARPGWSARTVNSGGRERCYHLYVPSGHDPAQPVPLILSLHGYVLNPDTQAAITGWHELAEREGFIVAYLQGTSYPRRWNSGATWNAGTVDDVQFIRDLVAELAETTAVDQSRIYVNGFSNGGGMSVRTGCDAADLVAAIGSVAGAVVDTTECNPSRPMPAIAFHGTADWIVPYEGGNMTVLPLRYAAELVKAPFYFVAAEDWVATLAGLNGCDPTAERLPPQGDVLGRRYTGCDQGVEVLLYTVEGGGHQWPGGGTIPGAGKNTMDIDATEEMWRFFQNYSLEQ